MKNCLVSSVFLISIIFLTACASTQTKSKNNLGSTTPSLPVQMLFSNHRNLELEPCGCSMGPVGGLHREWNYLEKIRRDFPEALYFISGTSFIPEVDMRAPKNKQFYELKSQSLVEAYQLLKISALSPATDDLYWGQAQIEAWAQKAGTPLVSTNLYNKATGQSLFKPYLEFEREKTRILVLAVAVSPRKDVKVDSNIEVRDPFESIDKILSGEVGARSGVVILLSQLADSDVKAIAERFPKINIILGSEPNRDVGKSEQMSATTAWIAPGRRGRSVVRVGIDRARTIEALYNPSKARDHLFSRRVFQEKLDDVRAELKNKPTKKQRLALEERQKNLESFMLRSSKVPTEISSSSTLYEMQEARLDETYQSAENNIMDGLLSRLKDKTRELALSDDEEGGHH